MVEFIPFLILFIALVSLLKNRPGKPWLILIAAVGMMYGIICSFLIPSIKPTILKDLYSDLENPTIFNFGYWPPRDT